MMIRQDFTEMPPRMFMMQVMNDILKIYCFLWEKRDRVNRISLSWKEIAMIYHKNLFKSSLRKLNNEGLLNYDESQDGVSIELVGWDDISDD